MKKLTPNLIVDDIETSLPFWVERLGFQQVAAVPEDGTGGPDDGPTEGKKLGFVILVRDTVELMLQSRASLAKDLPAIADGPYRSIFYLEVADLAPIHQALDGWPILETRTTPYGAHELITDDPAGNRVFFAVHPEKK